MVNELILDISFIGTSAPVAPVAYAIKTPANLPFKASHVLLKNDANITMRCSLTTALTTGSCILLTSGEERFWQGLQSGVETISLLCTSSSTAGFALRLGAWS
jgi:hypothetical protein